ncbi:hypothetical protein [Nonomuraea sp. NPDC050783]|uniref:hypothetical protein n=1 Tax=Nonomuraea sp. NPDC050783 TaxID=3154634 RepID=UPI003465B442
MSGIAGTLAVAFGLWAVGLLEGWVCCCFLAGNVGSGSTFSASLGRCRVCVLLAVFLGWAAGGAGTLT